MSTVDERISYQRGRIAGNVARLDALEQEVADHETRITHQAADQVEYLGRLDALAERVRELARGGLPLESAWVRFQKAIDAYPLDVTEEKEED